MATETPVLAEGELSKMLHYATVELVRNGATFGLCSRRAPERATERYARTSATSHNETTGETRLNANPYVPWTDPQIAFVCACDAVIYADTEHHCGASF